MPMPGDNTFGRRKGSYSPGDDNLDSTPYKPVPLAFQQADGTMPMMENLDRNANKNGPPAAPLPPPNSTSSAAANGGHHHPHRQADDRDRRKRLYLIAAVIIVLIILLILILTLSICLGTDMCTSSFSSSSASSSNAAEGRRYPHEGLLPGEFFASVYPHPGYVPFSRYVNASLSGIGNDTIYEEPFAPNSTTNHRRKRESDTTDRADQQHSSSSSIGHHRIDGYSDVDRYLIEKINEPLIQALKASELCGGGSIDCENVVFDEMKLNTFPDRDDLSYRFNVTVGSNDPIKITPETIFQTITSAQRNFSRGFDDVFPGYHLGVVTISFDSEAFCAFESVHCSNFTGLVDEEPTTKMVGGWDEGTTTVSMEEGEMMEGSNTTTTNKTNNQANNETETANNETETVPDRSELLPPIVQIFSTTTVDESSMMTTTATSTNPAGALVESGTTAEDVKVEERDADGGGKHPAGLADCSAYGWVCANQVDHVSVGGRCDGIIQCPDGSDEKLCEQCRTSFSCPIGDGNWMCRRGKILCDGEPVCPTKYDESPMHCKSTCLSSEYNCRGSKICIPKSWLCDGDEQCPQGDDESGCDNEKKCNNHAFFCTADRRCLASWARCNGVRDCSDGADEQTCTCSECSGNSTALCSVDGRCILRKQVCDGRRDCPNGEDEIHCSS